MRYCKEKCDVIKIIKKKININDELKTKINRSCKFSKQKYKIYEGFLRIIEHTNLAKLRHISDSLCAEYGLSTLDENIDYKNTYKNKEIRKYDKYCKDIKEIAKSMQDNINNFDKDIQKRKRQF